VQCQSFLGPRYLVRSNSPVALRVAPFAPTLSDLARRKSCNVSPRSGRTCCQGDRTDSHNLFLANDLQAGDLGFEPRLSDPESLVLPLHQSPRTCGKRTSRLISYATDLPCPFQDGQRAACTRSQLLASRQRFITTLLNLGTTCDRDDCADSTAVMM
jgi:hypothetical protein